MTAAREMQLVSTNDQLRRVLVQQVECRIHYQPEYPGSSLHPPTCRSEEDPLMSAPPHSFYPNSKTPANVYLSCIVLISPSLCDPLCLPLCHTFSHSQHPRSSSVSPPLTTSNSTQPFYRPTDHPFILYTPPPASFKDAPGCVLVTPPTEIKS